MRTVIKTVITIYQCDIFKNFLTSGIKNRLTAFMPSAESHYIYSEAEPSARITLAAIGAAVSAPKPPSLTQTTKA